jgi:mRNA-degrading endonuclease RelE of RelBE toxin-antitoxin system
MSYKVELSENFKKEAKKLTKKYPSLKVELAVMPQFTEPKYRKYELK